MARIGFSERVRLVALRAGGLGRRASTHILGSNVPGWRPLMAAPRQLVIVPPVLRSTDPSFWPEVQAGHFGLSGAIAQIGKGTPFDIAPPSTSWARDLHAFAWMRHLEAVEDPAAVACARRFTAVWLRKDRGSRGIAGEPAVRARRILSFLSHAPVLLDGATEFEFDRFARTLSRDIALLGATWRRTRDGYDRLQAATALVMARLAVDGGGRHLPAALDRLEAEIGRQLLSDGGPVNRNPAALIEILLDWLPLKSCLDSRRIETPVALDHAIYRILALLRFLRLGDGGIARFNGMGVGDPAGLATLLAYDDGPLPAFAIAPASLYARLARSGTVILADAGPPPPLMASSTAHAGCLSVEISAGNQLLICNAGAPGSADAAWRSVARSTACHSTVCLGEMSSSRLVRHARLEAVLGAVPLQLPARVTATVKEAGGDGVLQASHDGYLERLGLFHSREVRLAADGLEITGLDRLSTKGGQDRLKRDVPFAAHFHLHPDSETEPSPPTGIIIRLRDGQRWLFQASGFPAGVEESLYFAGNSGPRSALQIVVRGATGGVTDVSWTLKRLHPARPDAASADNEGTPL